MDTVYKCTGIAVVGALLILTTKKTSAEFGVLAAVAGVLIISTMALTFIKPLVSFLRELARRAELSTMLVRPVLRTLAVGYLTQAGKSICQEAGESTLGQALTLVGNVAAVYMLLPLMESLLELLEQLL